MRSSLVLLKGARALPDHETPRLRFLGSRARGLLAGLLFLSTCAESPLTAQEARDLPVSMVAPDWRSLDEFVENTRIQYRVPGVSVVIVKDDQVVLLKGYGVREIQKAAPVDADTVFRLASVSKVFTATSAATLVEKGKIKWDQPLVELLPDLRLINDQAGRQASLRDCLAHRVGFSPASGAFLEAMGFTRKEFVSRLQHFQMPGAFREHAAYSSVGYFIAGEALSQISGQPVEDFVTQSVLSPLGMHRTT
ncbi:MAG: serine hydrolase domain-containing protein, partial [Verrucomicrobium sp.]